MLVRAGSGGGTHEFLRWLTARSRPLHYSVGMTITEDMQAAIGKVPAAAWTPPYDGDGQVRNGARPGLGRGTGVLAVAHPAADEQPVRAAAGAPPAKLTGVLR